MKKILVIIISILVFVLGLGAMFYPTVSNWLHEQSASYAIADYMESTGEKSVDEYELEFAAARAYNATLTGDVRSFLEAEEQAASEEAINLDYWDTFDQVDGIMGIVEIPSINVTLPIYHGTEESALQKGAGHLEGSALPTGDVGNHTVITGHTGLPSAMLFTDLDEMIVGDRFYLEILDQVFTYEVTRIYVVLPSETEHLEVQEDKDLVTLVTCTPYGVNSHRLLVQGERVEDEETPTTLVSVPTTTTDSQETSTVLQNLPTLVIVGAVCGVIFLVAIIVFIVGGRHKPTAVTSSPPEDTIEPAPPEETKE